MIAALYIDLRGPYPTMPGVECWGLPDRDARLYDGPWPLVAHPPCGPWGQLRHLYRGQEHDCAPIAVAQVRRWCGVVEHPEHSRVWDSERLPYPGEFPDQWGGYSLAIDQVEWGHVARKRTWLYLVGVPHSALDEPPFPARAPTHWVSGARKPRYGAGGAVPRGIKVCSAQQRRRTPLPFAEYLVRLAEATRRARRKAS